MNYLYLIYLVILLILYRTFKILYTNFNMRTYKKTDQPIQMDRYTDRYV